MDVTNLTITAFQEGLRAKRFSAEEAVRAFFDFIETKDKEIGAFVRLTKDRALSRAKKVDVDFSEGRPLHSLAGVPLAIKDNILIEGEVASAGSRMLQYHRAQYDATVTRRLTNQDAVFLGVTNMDEFAMGSSTESSAFQTTKNPRDLERVPGGSSGGSAAAVGAHMALGALGSDTGGSIRQPAAFCGVVGLKPTYGAVSRHGLIAMASSLDQIGPFAKTVEDVAILFEAIRGFDLYDATSVETSQESTFPIDASRTPEFSIGLPREYFSGSMDPAVERALQKAIDVFRAKGITIKEVSLPHTKYAVSCYYIIMPAEVSSNLARFDGLRYGAAPDAIPSTLSLLARYLHNRGAGFGDEVKRRILLGTFVLSSGYYDAYYAKAQKVRRLITDDFARVFEDVDMLLTPVTPTLPFRIGEKINDPLSMYLSDIFTIPTNLAGLPALSLPVRGIEGLPVGFQLIGKPFREADILRCGAWYEHVA